MLTAIIALAIFGLIVAGWSSTRAAAEVAIHYGQRACAESGVQWLDHSVALERISLKRAPDGWLRPLRRYRFDYSTDGHDRHRAQLELLGDELQWLHMPPPPGTRLGVQEPAAAEGASWQVQLTLASSAPTATNPPASASSAAPEKEQ